MTDKNVTTALPGKFITVEGIEGAGKSTCMAVISDLLKSAGKQLVTTREPGGTPLAEDLRDLLLSHKHTGMQDDTELMLMFAARAEHLGSKIKPALAAGQWVLSDRFTDATYAYQGGGRNISLQRIQTLENWVQQGLMPDLTLLMDLPVEVGLERASKRSAPDRFEKEKMAFFERVRQSYLDIAQRQKQRVVVINANQMLDKVTEDITQSIKRFINEQ